METMKTWRSKLKKTGASALAAFMLCGSFSAFAQEQGSGGGITTNSTTGDADKAGNVKTVTGYQTDRAVGYAAKITWGDMVFVYDRGTYDPNTGALVGSFQDRVSEVEAGATVTDGDKVTSAGYWYGFDGENNSVTIENLSTEAINITATPSVYQEEGSKVGDKVAFTLYVDETEGKEWDGVSAADKKFPDYAMDNAKVGATNTAINRNFAAAERNNSGEIDENTVDTETIWLNITGRPTDKFMDQKTYEIPAEGSRVGDKIGTITLSFKTTDDKDLTPTAVKENS